MLLYKWAGSPGRSEIQKMLQKGEIIITIIIIIIIITFQPQLISNLSIFSSKEEYKTTSWDKFEENKHTHTISTCQNWRFVSFEGNSSKRKLYEQNQPQRCFFFSSLKLRISKTCVVSMEGSNIPISMSMIFVENFNSSVKKVDGATKRNWKWLEKVWYILYWMSVSR